MHIDKILWRIKLPKAIPHVPWNTVSKMTNMTEPSMAIWKTQIITANTNIVWPTITKYCVNMWALSTSTFVTPETKVLFNIPSFRSVMKADPVRATDMKKIIL